MYVDIPTLLYTFHTNYLCFFYLIVENNNDRICFIKKVQM